MFLVVVVLLLISQLCVTYPKILIAAVKNKPSTTFSEETVRYFGKDVPVDSLEFTVGWVTVYYAATSMVEPCISQILARVFVFFSKQKRDLLKPSTSRGDLELVLSPGYTFSRVDPLFDGPNRPVGIPCLRSGDGSAQARGNSRGDFLH